MKKLIFEYKNVKNGKTKADIELWFYPVRTAVIASLGIVVFLLWKVFN